MSLKREEKAILEMRRVVRIFLILFLLLFVFPSLFPSLRVAADPGASWPTSWIQIDSDPNENGPIDDWRDVKYAYYQYDSSYLYLKLKCYDTPGKEWPNGKEGRYKWFIDLEGNMYYSGGNIFDAEYLIFVEDTDDNVTGEMYLLFETSGDNNFGEYEPWPPANYANYKVTDPNVGGWRIVAPYQIEMYISWTSIGNPPSYWITWATDQENPNLDQGPTTDRVDEADIAIAVHDVAAISQTPTPTSVAQGETVTVEVVVENQGTQTETFNVTSYFDTGVIGTLLVTNLAAGKSITLNFSWDTTGVTPGTYNITAWADSNGVITENDEADNWCTAPATVTIRTAEYYLTVETDPAGIVTITGEGWYPNCTYVNLTAPAVVPNVTGVQYIFDQWTVDGGLVSGNPITVHMDANHTATAHYVQQYYLTVSSDHGTPGGEDWYNTSDTTYATVTPLVVSGPMGVQYVFKGWSGDASGSSSPSDPIIMDGPKTAVANWKTQYLITFNHTGLDINATGTVVMVNGSAKAFGDLPFTWWVDNCSWVEYSYSATVSSLDPNENFTLINVTGPSSPFHVGSPVTVTGNYQSVYKVQYYLDVSSDHGTPGGMGWYDDGDTAYATLDTGIIDHGNGTRRVFTHWSGDASGTDYAQSDPITMDGNKTAIANWQTQYYLTVTSAHGTPGGEDWYNASDTAYATITPLTVAGSTGVQYVFTGWSGDASGSGSPSNPITMDGPKTAVADWKTQYYLTVSSPYGTPGGEGWYDSGSTAYATVSPLTVSGSPDVQYVFTGWSGNASGSSSPSNPITMDGPKTAIANWETQYYLTVNTDPAGLSPAPTPSSGWYDNCTYVILTAPDQSDLNDDKYLFSHWDVDGTNVTGNPINVHMDQPHTATAHYVALSKCVVDFTEDPESPISFGTTVTFTVNVTQKAFNGTHEVNCTLYEWNITDPNGVSHILRYGKQWNNFSDTMQWTFDVYGYWTVTLRAFCNDTTLIDAGMAWSDPASHPKMVLQPVGGYVIPVCKLDLLVPWTGFVFSLLAVMAATIALFRRGSRKH